MFLKLFLGRVKILIWVKVFLPRYQTLFSQKFLGWKTYLAFPNLASLLLHCNSWLACYMMLLFHFRSGSHACWIWNCTTFGLVINLLFSWSGSDRGKKQQASHRLECQNPCPAGLHQTWCITKHTYIYSIDHTMAALVSTFLCISVDFLQERTPASKCNIVCTPLILLHVREDSL